MVNGDHGVTGHHAPNHAAYLPEFLFIDVDDATHLYLKMVANVVSETTLNLSLAVLLLVQVCLRL